MLMPPGNVRQIYDLADYVTGLAQNGLQCHYCKDFDGLYRPLTCFDWLQAKNCLVIVRTKQKSRQSPVKFYIGWRFPSNWVGTNTKHNSSHLAIEEEAAVVQAGEGAAVVVASPADAVLVGAGGLLLPSCCCCALLHLATTELYCCISITAASSSTYRLEDISKVRQLKKNMIKK